MSLNPLLVDFLLRTLIRFIFVRVPFAGELLLGYLGDIDVFPMNFVRGKALAFAFVCLDASGIGINL